MNAATGRTKPSLFDAAEVNRAVSILAEPDGVVELRILNATVGGDRWAGTYSGYFDSAEALADSLQTVSSASGCYVTLNPVNAALLARACNRIDRAGKNSTTSDRDISRRRWLLVDLDAERPAGISATHEERELARSIMQAVELVLHDHGWPDSVVADSGNGFHLLYRVDLPADDDGLVERCLKSLASRFNDGQVKVDTSVHNPARITKLYGTLVCKGDDTPDRPHRMATLLEVPDRLEPVARELLEELAAMAPADSKPHEQNGKANGQHSTTAFDIDAFIHRHNLDVSGPDAWNGGRKWTFKTSPMCEHHGDGPYLTQFANGALAAGCHHDSCSWRWQDLREQLEPRAEQQPGERHNEQKTERTAIVYERITSAELAKADYSQEYLIENILVARQPLIIAGSHKTLKTSLIIDAAISLALGGFYLGKFKVARQCRVGVMTGESGLSTIQETANRVCIAANIRLAQLENLIWSPDLPRFGDVRHLNALEKFIDNDGIEVLPIDPAYLCLPGADAGNLMMQGELLSSVSQLCQERGVTMMLAHHTKRHTGRDAFDYPELSDIAWSGFAEFARQWWLIGRRERYEPGTGEHRLWLSVGGSAGHGGLWALDVNEGTRQSLEGRYWQVDVSSASEAQEQTEQRRDDAQQARQAKQQEDDVRAIVNAMTSLTGNEGTKTDIRDASGIRSTRFGPALASAIAAGYLEPTAISKGNNRDYDGYKLNESDD